MPQNRKRRTGKSKRSPKGPSATRPAKQPKVGASRATNIIWVIIFVLLIGGVVYYIMRDKGTTGTEVTTASGLKYTDQVEGTGATAKSGKTVSVNYTGTLENGTKFDSSRDPGKKPLEFVLGSGRMIKGWDEGLVGMKVGGKRKLVVPPELGYGKQSQPKIPPDSILVFEVELMGVK